MRNLVMLVLVLLVAGSLFCQDVEDQAEEAILKSKMAQAKAEQIVKEMEGEYTINVTVDDNGDKIVITTPDDLKSDKPFIGITYSDMTLAEAAEIGYNHFYGIRLTNVVPNSPAYYYKLRTDDILMSINDDKITKQDELGKILSFYRVGEKVTLTIFRKGEEMELDFAFGTRKMIYDLEGNIVMDNTEKKMGETVIKKHKKDYGEGSIAWMPIWYTPDVVDVNGIMKDLGFEEDMYSEDGLFLNGIGLKSHIGKGWFIGGQYAQYFDKTTTRHDWNHNIANLDSTSNVARTAKYWINYGGLSFDRRFVVGKLYSEIGCMFTWGINNIEVTQKASDDVPDYDFDGDMNLDTYLDEYYNLSSSIKFKNTGFLAEPRISLGWRVTDWLSFKAEAAYLYTVSMSGWEGEANGYDINLTNRPDTNMDGLTLSFGPWFGF